MVIYFHCFPGHLYQCPLLCLITILNSTYKCIMYLFAFLSLPPKSKLSHQGSFVLVLFTSVFLAHKRRSAILSWMKCLHGSDSSLGVKISGGRTMKKFLRVWAPTLKVQLYKFLALKTVRGKWPILPKLQSSSQKNEVNKYPLPRTAVSIKWANECKTFGTMLGMY